MGKKVIVIRKNGKEESYDTVGLARTALNVDRSTIGKICNEKEPQRAGFEVKWADPESKVTTHGNDEGVTCRNNGKEFDSMYNTKKFYGVSQKAIHDACEYNKPIKYKGELIYLCYTKDRHKYMADFINYLQKATAKLEENKKPAKAKVKPRLVIHRVAI